METVISINKLHVNYGNTVALQDVNLDIHKNEFLGIIGPNGGGKTTLVRTILGLIEPLDGQITIEDDVVVGYVPQLTTFDRGFPITVKDVILTGHLPRRFQIFRGFSKHDIEHANRIMERLEIAHLAKRQIGKLSGGQMQRVLIARALMNHPNVLILDEPTTGVDEEAKGEVYSLLSEINKDITIVMITHDTSVLNGYLDRIVYINKGAHVYMENGELVNRDNLQSQQTIKKIKKEESSYA